MSDAQVEQPKKRRRAALGPHTREPRLLEGLDWRTREGQVLIAARAELTAHVGGNPNSVQKALIERAARLTLYIELMDAEALVAGTMSERNSRQYLAWVNALRLCLREIGVDEAKPAKTPDLSDIVAEHGTARSARGRLPSLTRSAAVRRGVPRSLDVAGLAGVFGGPVRHCDVGGSG